MDADHPNTSPFTDEDTVGRLERAAALNCAAIVAPLARLEPGLGSVFLPLADGHVVLLGPGMYVNRGIAMGLGIEVSSDDLATLETLSEQAGVTAEVEVSPWARSSLLETTAARGYQAAWFRSTLVYELEDDHLATSRSTIGIDEVGDDEALSLWQQTAADGFGYTTSAQRATSDMFAAASYATEGTHLYLARIDGRPVGVASLTVRDLVANLWGMTTLPSARRQGVQSELIRHRLAVAMNAGCDVAVSTADPGGVSERNLVRHGFSIIYTKIGLCK